MLETTRPSVYECPGHQGPLSVVPGDYGPEIGSLCMEGVSHRVRHSPDPGLLSDLWTRSTPKTTSIVLGQYYFLSKASIPNNQLQAELDKSIVVLE